MIELAKTFSLYSLGPAKLIHVHQDKKILAFLRTDLVFVFNLHPSVSYTDYLLNAPPGKYIMIFDSDKKKYGGYERLVPVQTHFTLSENGCLSLYLPARTSLVLELQS